MAANGYDPHRTRNDPAKLAEFLRCDNLSGNLDEIPGVGPATIKKLAECDDKIETIFQLFGKYLSLKGRDVNPMQHADRFFYWLEDIGVAPGYRSDVVQCICEKTNLTFPGIYDADVYN